MPRALIVTEPPVAPEPFRLAMETKQKLGAVAEQIITAARLLA